MAEDKIAAGGTQPEGPTKPTVSSDTLEAYFQSIRQAFDETREGLARDHGSPIFVLFFIFCLIPLFPYIFWKIASRYLGSTTVSVWSARIHLASFWFWWVGFFIVSLVVLLIATKASGVPSETKKRWLSPPQMRFAYCYGTVYEIRTYTKNRMQRHIDTALEYLGKTANYFYWVAPPSGSISFADHRSFVQQQTMFGVEATRGCPPKWYRLRPETEQILEAFKDFDVKLRDRVKDRKDLPAVETALTYLASYQHSEIPELSDSTSEARFDEGIQSLLSFAQQMKSLPPYRSEQLKPTPKQKLSQKLFAFCLGIMALFRHQNVLLAFASWLLLLSFLFGLAMFIALRHFQVKPDSTIVTALISGPILGAVTAVTIPRIGKRTD